MSPAFSGRFPGSLQLPADPERHRAREQSSRRQGGPSHTGVTGGSDAIPSQLRCRSSSFSLPNVESFPGCRTSIPTFPFHREGGRGKYLGTGVSIKQKVGNCTAHSFWTCQVRSARTLILLNLHPLSPICLALSRWEDTVFLLPEWGEAYRAREEGSTSLSPSPLSTPVTFCTLFPFDLKASRI